MLDVFVVMPLQGVCVCVCVVMLLQGVCVCVCRSGFAYIVWSRSPIKDQSIICWIVRSSQQSPQGHYKHKQCINENKINKKHMV